MKCVFFIAFIAIACKAPVSSLEAQRSIDQPQREVSRLNELGFQYQSEFNLAKDVQEKNDVTARYARQIKNYLVDTCHSKIDRVKLQVTYFKKFGMSPVVAEFASGSFRVQYEVADDDPNFKFISGLKEGDEISARVVYTRGIGLPTGGNEHQYIIQGAVYPIDVK
jgi:hypothetical protein